MRQSALEQMLDDWGQYHAAIEPLLGWDVNVLDFSGEVPRGCQKRNDTHADPVAREHGRMHHDQRVAMTVDTAVRELSRAQWIAIAAKHCEWPNQDNPKIAQKLNWRPKNFSRHLREAYAELHNSLILLCSEYRNAA